MESEAKLIHNASVSYLPTKLPVQYYGMPDGAIFLIFARFYRAGEKSGIEYVIARHKEFRFDYKKDKVYSVYAREANLQFHNESVDKPNPKIKILRRYKKVNSFAEAQYKLNELAKTEGNKLLKTNLQKRAVKKSFVLNSN